MKIAFLLLKNCIRVIGLLLIVLGFLFWSGHSFNLVPVHMRLGEVLVALLWLLAILALRTRVNRGLLVVALLWGLLVVLFGMNMGQWLPGRAHEVVRVVHFLIGLIAIGLSESISARIKRSAAIAG